MYNSGINSIIAILSMLASSNERKEVRGWWKRLIGIGLTASDFDQFKPKISRKKFNDKKDYLQNHKLIKLLEFKGKSSYYYSITPLGMVYLIQKIGVDHETLFGEVIKSLQFFLGQYSNKNDEDDDPLLDYNLVDTLLSKLGKKLLFASLNNVCRNISLSMDDNTTIVLRHIFDGSKSLTKQVFMIKSRQIYEMNASDNLPNSITNEIFYHDVSKFILLELHYTLIRILIKDKKRLSDFYKKPMLNKIDDFNTELGGVIASMFNESIKIQTILTKYLS